MKITTKKAYWTAEEAAEIVELRTGTKALATVDGLELSLDFGAVEVTQSDAKNLSTYFGAVHDRPTVAEKEAQAERAAKIKVLRDKGDNLTLPELREAFMLLTENT